MPFTHPSSRRHAFQLTLGLLVAAPLALAPLAPARAAGSGDDGPIYTEAMGIGMETWPYPARVQYLPLRIEGQDLRMAFMDVAPVGPANGRTVVLMHGKNFGGFYWAGPIRALTQAGYRVVVPDQIGFGRSSKPAIRYTFDLLAAKTVELLDLLKLTRVDVIGHSTGGALAIRFARTYPDRVGHLVLEDPVGLEDYRRYVPPEPVETEYRFTMKQSQADYRRYVHGYFVHWRPEFEQLVEPYARMKLSGEYPRYALSSALTYEMIYEQPVVYDLPHIRAKTLLIVGGADRTALGKQFVSPAVAKEMGNFPELGKAAAAAIPDARLVVIPDVGHIPHLEVPQRFDSLVLDFLKAGK